MALRHSTPIGILVGLALVFRSAGFFDDKQDTDQTQETPKPRQANNVKQITPNSIRIEPLTDAGEEGWITLEGYAEIGSPSISPDNESVAFDARRLGYGRSPGEIWIAGRDGAKLRKLVNGATPRWSPDSDQILFFRRDAAGNSFVRLINADGTNEQKLCPGSWPDWSPDGSQIVFSQGGKRGGGAKLLAQVFIAKQDGSDPELVAAGDCPSWSPDGTRIACCYRDLAMGAPLIRVVDLGANQERFVGVGWFRANWTSDGKSVVANAPVAFRKTGMVKLNALKREAPKPIHAEYRSPSSPHQSSDGVYNVFVAQKPGN